MSKKRTADYWKKRFESLEGLSNAYGQQTFRQIEPAFDKALRQIEGAIEAWYGRFAANNQITMQEARKLLTSKELKELKWDVKEYIKYGRENDLNHMWIKELENASAKYHISRLEALKIRTQHAAEVAFGNEMDSIDDMARKVFTENYYHSIFEMQKGFNIGWEIGQIDNRKLDKLISKPWAADGKHFSQRIWEQRSQLVSELHNQLTRTCILGKAPDGAIKDIAKKFNTTKKQAGRLVMTEQAYFHSVSQKAAFEELDVEEFEIVATLDSHTSDICQEMDGQHFPMKEYEAGVTAPPFHPWCRSVTVPWFEDNYTGERAARDEETGKTYYVPDSMKYPEWKNGFVDGGNKSDLTEITLEETGEWTPKKTDSMKRDPANFKKSESVEEPVRELTIEDVNERGSRMLGDVYEHHRINNEMTSVPYNELGDSATDIVNANYGKMSVESATAFNNTIEELVSEYDTPLQKIRTMTRDEFMAHGDSFAYVTHNYTVDSAELVINPTKCKDIDKLTDRIKELSENGYCVNIPEELADRYVATHEFAHTLLNMEDKLNNKTNWLNADYDKIKKARKEVKSIYDDYMKEVEILTKAREEAELLALTEITDENWIKAEKAIDALDMVKLSDYSLENADEFMAEAFTQGKIGVNKNKYSDAIIEIIDKHFRR